MKRASIVGLMTRYHAHEKQTDTYTRNLREKIDSYVKNLGEIVGSDLKSLNEKVDSQKHSSTNIIITVILCAVAIIAAMIGMAFFVPQHSHGQEYLEHNVETQECINSSLVS